MLTTQSHRLLCREGNLDASKLHEVVLVGGCAHIPRLQTAFKDALGKSPTIAKERDSAARGAAVQVAVMQDCACDDPAGIACGSNLVPRSG